MEHDEAAIEEVADGVPDLGECLAGLGVGDDDATEFEAAHEVQAEGEREVVFDPNGARPAAFDEGEGDGLRVPVPAESGAAQFGGGVGGGERDEVADGDAALDAGLQFGGASERIVAIDEGDAGGVAEVGHAVEDE